MIIRTSLYTSEQQSLFSALHVNDNSGKNFTALCEMLDNDMVLNARDQRVGFEGLTLLHEAAQLDRVEVIQMLLSQGMPVDCVDSSVSLVTPLMEAISNASYESALLLVKSGADLTHCDARNDNCLHYAARVGSRMVLSIVAGSRLGRAAIMELASTANVKLKFPEDVSCNAVTKEVLVDLREEGVHKKPASSKKKTTKKSTRMRTN